MTSGNRFIRTTLPTEELTVVKGLQSGTKAGSDGLPKPLLQHHTYSSNSSPLNSGRTSPTLTDHTITPGISGLHGGWITGNSTERSTGSIDSLDDIDRQASYTVTKHLNTIKAVLFEGDSIDDWSICTQVLKGSQTDNLRECQEWRSQFHHLRVLGNYIPDPWTQSGQGQTKDQGVQAILRETSSPQQDMLFDYTGGTTDTSHYLVIGRGILPKHPPTEATALTNTDHDTNNGFEFLQEEIFAQDGIYEEIMAIDDERLEDQLTPVKRVTTSRRRIGYPPITPNACISNSVMTRLFDDLWKWVIDYLWLLIQKEYPSLFDDVLQQTLDVNPSSPHHNNPSPPSRQPSFNFQPRNLYISRANTHGGGILDSQKSFDGILQISRVQINSRDALEGSGIIVNRPGSSIQSRQRPTTTSRYLTKFVTKGSRLPPLYVNEKSKEEEIVTDTLHVKKLTPYNTVESISPPPTSATYTRNGALPPLHMDRERKTFHRASSAVDNKDIRGLYSIQRGQLPYDQRPSTTHAMRSDNLPGSSISRRSSTPLGHNKTIFGARPLNVTGSGLQPSSDYAAHMQPDIVEDHEGSIEDGILHNNQWPSTNSSNNNPYKRHKIRYLLQT